MAHATRTQPNFKTCCHELAASKMMRRCASLVGLLIAVRIGAAAGRDAVDEVPNFMKSARPAPGRPHLAPRRRRLSDFVNTGTSTAPKFDEQFGSANPFDAINLDVVTGPSSPVFADLDGDGTLKPCPSIGSDRDPTFRLSQATWTSFQATSTTSTTSEQLQCRSLRQQQAPPTPSTVLTSRIEVPSRSLILTATAT